jgi:hypothetical protein
MCGIGVVHVLSAPRAAVLIGGRGVVGSIAATHAGRELSRTATSTMVSAGSAHGRRRVVT